MRYVDERGEAVHRTPQLCEGNVNVQGASPALRDRSFIPVATDVDFSPIWRHVGDYEDGAKEAMEFRVQAGRRVNPIAIPLVFIVTVWDSSLHYSIAKEVRTIMAARVTHYRVRTSGSVHSRDGYSVRQVIVIRPTVSGRRAIRPSENGRHQGHRANARNGQGTTFIRCVIFAAGRVSHRADGQSRGEVGVSQVIVASHRIQGRILRILTFRGSVSRPIFLLRPREWESCVALHLLFFERRRVAAFRFITRRRVPILRLCRSFSLVQTMASDVRAPSGHPRANPDRSVSQCASFLRRFRCPSVHRAFYATATRRSYSFLTFSHRPEPNGRTCGRGERMFLRRRGPFFDYCPRVCSSADELLSVIAASWQVPCLCPVTGVCFIVASHGGEVRGAWRIPSVFRRAATQAECVLSCRGPCTALTTAI